MKTCSKCKERQPNCEFYKDTARLDGLRSQCKYCDGVRYHGKKQRAISKLFKTWGVVN